MLFNFNFDIGQVIDFFKLKVSISETVPIIMCSIIHHLSEQTYQSTMNSLKEKVQRQEE